MLWKSSLSTKPVDFYLDGQQWFPAVILYLKFRL